MRRHPRRALLLAGGDRAMLHAETCERCADILVADDGDERLGGQVQSLLAGLLEPEPGFAERAASATLERIGMQDLWELVSDTVGGVGDAIGLVAGTSFDDASQDAQSAGGTVVEGEN